MPKEQILIGVLVALLCAVGLWNNRWFLTSTRKGQRLIHWLGEERAVWLLRGLFAAGMTFGILLATGVIHPVQW